MSGAPPPLLTTRSVAGDLGEYLPRCGTVFRTFCNASSRVVGFGVRIGDQQVFVKARYREEHQPALRNGAAIHRSVQHPALARYVNCFSFAGGLAVVYSWLCGEALRDPGMANDDPRRHEPLRRFRGLPAANRLAAVNGIYDLHRLLAARGLIAVDFYDGSIIYDWRRNEVRVCDLDGYRHGSFVLQSDRLPGSRRFMAPEEYVRGARIDQRTNVFVLGRTALVLMGDGQPDAATFSGSARLLAVIRKATQRDPADRYATVGELVAAWSAAQRRG